MLNFFWTKLNTIRHIQEFKEFCSTKIYLTQIWYDEFHQYAFKVNNFLHIQHDFLTLDKY